MVILNAGYSGTFTFDGANIDLTLTTVPEPSTWLAGALALGAIGFMRPRRRVRAVLYAYPLFVKTLNSEKLTCCARPRVTRHLLLEQGSRFLAKFNMRHFV